LYQFFPGRGISLGVGESVVEATLEDVPDVIRVILVVDLLNPL